MRRRGSPLEHLFREAEEDGARDAAALAGRHHGLVRRGSFPEAPPVEGPANHGVTLGRARAIAEMFDRFDTEESCD